MPPTIPGALTSLVSLNEVLEEPSRNRYPGSARVDPRRRWKHYALREEDHGRARASLQEDEELFGGIRLRSTLLPDPRKSIFCSPTEHNVPDALPLDRVDPVHGVLLVGRAGCGRTTLARSLAAAAAGEHGKGLPHATTHSDTQSYVVQAGMPIRTAAGGVGRIPLVLTDTLPLDYIEDERGGFCADAFNAGRFSHRAVVFVVDAAAPPLWKDESYRQRISSLMSTCRYRGYTVLVAVAKLEHARQYITDLRLRLAPGDRKTRDPRACYEDFVGRYLSKLCDTLESAIRTCETKPSSLQFPVLNSSLFDAPAWLDAEAWQAGLERHGGIGSKAPTWTYTHSQLHRLLQAATAESNTQAPLPPVYRAEALQGGGFRRPWTR